MSDYEERVRKVVFDTADDEMAKAECVGVSARHHVAHAIATRVASQLASAAPVLSAEEREALGELRTTLAPAYAVAGPALRALDRLLGASR